MNTIQQTQKDLPQRQLLDHEAEELARLSETARQARGEYYPEHVEEASRELSRLIYEYLNSGVRYQTLSQATGVQWRTLKSRLGRHGYLDTVPPSQEGKKFRGPKTPGPKCDHNPSRFRRRIEKKTGKLVHVECLDCRNEKRKSKTRYQGRN